MARLLLSFSLAGMNQAQITLSVYLDACHASVSEYGVTLNVGWFIDEVDAMSAALEGIIFRSALVPELRRLPAFTVQSEYIPHRCRKPADAFRRATQSRGAPGGRRFVRLPCASYKQWI